MKRPCECCLKQRGTRLVFVKGVAFLVCQACTPAVKRSAA